MAGAFKRAERVRENVWFSAMLPNLKKPPTLDEFVGGKKDKTRELTRFLEAWDRVDAALAANKNRAA
jgi:hypothetical protein